MEIQHARIGMPLLDGLADSVVIQRARSTEPPGQVFLRADIVAGKHMQTAKTSQQDVLGRPSSDAAQLTQLRERLFVALEGQTFDAYFASLDSTSQRQ